MIRYLTAIGMIAVWAQAMRAQDALTFDSLADKISPYFAPELIQDVKGVLPQAPLDIWGYGVGDYSGDGHPDLIITARRKGDTRRRMSIYFFVDDEGTLKLIRESTADFVTAPIEVGVNIDQGNAYVVQKQKDFQWEIKGFRFRDGVVMTVDKFATERQGTLTYENYRNYQSLESYERYLNTANGGVVFRSDFLATPCYTRGRDVSSGLNATAVAQTSKYVLQGAYYWSGPEDCSIETRAAYDPDYLYLSINVRDDQVYPTATAGVDSSADRIEIWLDAYTGANRQRTGKRARDFRVKIDTNVFAFIVQLGDFVTQPARVKIATSNTMDQVQNVGVRQVKVVSSRIDSGYTVKLRVPFSLLGFQRAPADDYSDVELGMAVVAYDVDNPYRLAETTVMATSQQFDATKPATYGALTILPQTMFYGEATNIYLSELKEHLRDIGF